MVRSVVLVKFRPGTTHTQIDALTSALEALDIPGLVNLSFGPDLGLREETMSFAFVLDFQDEGAFRAYDRDEAHNRIRRELFLPLVEQIARCQYRL